jgi:hypothetical protein
MTPTPKPSNTKPCTTGENKMKSLVNLLRKLSVRKIEATLIDTISAVTPWLAPLIPAYLVYRNMTTQLGYPPLFGLIGAAAVEFLGLSAVHTATTFWQWNDDHKNEHAPFWLALCAGLFYILIVLTVNAALDIWRGSDGVKIFAHALLSLLSVDAAVIIALRAQHARRLTERQSAKDERKAQRVNAQVASPAVAPQPQGATANRKPQTASKAKAQFIAAMNQRNGQGPLTTAQIMAQYQVSERTAQYWLTAYHAQAQPAEVLETVN